MVHFFSKHPLYFFALIPLMRLINISSRDFKLPPKNASTPIWQLTGERKPVRGMRVMRSKKNEALTKEIVSVTKQILSAVQEIISLTKQILSVVQKIISVTKQILSTVQEIDSVIK